MSEFALLAKQSMVAVLAAEESIEAMARKVLPKTSEDKSTKVPLGEVRLLQLQETTENKNKNKETHIQVHFDII